MTAPPATEEARAWVSRVHGPVGADDVEVRKHRPWATVWRMRTAAGVVWAKQTCPGHAAEAAVHRLLVAARPAAVVPLLACNDDERRLLTADAGPTLAEAGAASGPDAALLVQVMVEGAVLQRAAAASPALETCGARLLAPGSHAAYAEQALEQLSTLPAEDPRHVGADEAAGLRASLPRVERWDEQVGALGLPLTVQHNDLHPGNAVAIEGRIAFFDFADAVVAGPLGALLRPLGALAEHLQRPATDPAVLDLAEPALEVWSDLAPPSALRAALPAALRLGMLQGLEPWLSFYPTMDEQDVRDWGPVAPMLLREALSPTR
ncbi:phosphotransferase [Nocardioides nanhaiensis]|uniref:Aminoglycoside phosphotransferase domain-containing protein n=1 Tax=Nocardioides nanhaiensis TaxID=1476871 RepID=A0ABP8WYC5_9ACTN